MHFRGSKVVACYLICQAVAVNFTGASTMRSLRLSATDVTQEKLASPLNTISC